MKSCLYDGSVRHRRHRAAPTTSSATGCSWSISTWTSFPALFDARRLWSARRPALAWFRRRDHLGDPHLPLADAVARLVRERTGARPEGPIGLLTHLRYFGHCFNPVSFYYCYERPAATRRARSSRTSRTRRGARATPT